ncbi:MAG: hypothetical protein MJA29_02465 [Candidatus Omnitrophica bacterium]|nr:hypothetical protein [Candidatus Omnitrophota bacterium]
MISYFIGVRFSSLDRACKNACARRRPAISASVRRNLTNAAVFSTCNRLEIHGLADDTEALVKAGSYVEDLLNPVPGSVRRGFSSDETYLHGLRLACGLDSEIVGEREIVRQLLCWIDDPEFPAGLRAFWHDILAAARQIRAASGLDVYSRTIADLVFEHMFSTDKWRPGPVLLVIGTGKVAGLLADRVPQGCRLIFAARKKRPRAEQLALASGGSLVSFDRISQAVSLVDAVISATASPHPVLNAGMLRQAMSVRGRPLTVYDLAVPYDIDPRAAGVPGITLVTIDDLQKSRGVLPQELLSAVCTAERMIGEYASTRRGTAEPVGP